MAPTTRKKNRISYEELDEDVFDFDWEEDESGDFAESSADVDNVKPPAQKKPKLVKAKDAPLPKPPFEMLPQEVLTHMMLFLDNARDIYSLSMVGSKHIRGAITTEVVVRSAVFSGGKQQTRIQSLIDEGIKKKAVYLPDTFRLLRLVVATRCEQLHQCFGYNLETHRSSSLAKEAKLKFGMSICHLCARSAAASSYGIVGKYDWFLGKFEYGRAMHHHNGQYKVGKLIASQQTELGTSNKVGPLLTARMYHQIQATRGQVLSGADLDAAQDAIIADIPGYQERCDSIVEFFDAAQAHYPRFQQSQSDIAAEKQRIKDQERAKRKLKTQLKFLGRIKRALAGYKYKEQILSHRVDEHSKLQLYGPAQSVFQFVLEAPSKVTARTISSTLEQIKPIYDRLGNHGFLQGPGYMKPRKGLAGPREEYQVILFEYARENLDPLEILKYVGSKWSLVDSQYVESLEQPFVLPILRSMQELSPFDILMKFLDVDDFEKALKRYFSKRNASEEESAEFRIAAQLLRKNRHRLVLDPVWRRSTARVVCFKAFWKEHKTFCQKYERYLQHTQEESVVTALKEMFDLSESWNRPESVFCVFDWNALRLLKAENFNDLLEYEMNLSPEAARRTGKVVTSSAS